MSDLLVNLQIKRNNPKRYILNKFLSTTRDVEFWGFDPIQSSPGTSVDFSSTELSSSFTNSIEFDF
jgi:hypothetical protein